LFRIGKLSDDSIDLNALAAEPVCLNAPEGDYSHNSQTRVRKNADDTIMYTGGGTQTYNFQGRPSDNDSD
jgi:hypothetical protein